MPTLPSAPVSRCTFLPRLRAPAPAQSCRKRHCLINVSGKLQLYCYSKKMVPFISAPSAQTHSLLPRQLARTQRVCKSPRLTVFSSQGCGGTREANFSFWLPAAQLEDSIDWTSWWACATHSSIRAGPQGGDQQLSSACTDEKGQGTLFLVHPPIIYRTNNKETLLSARPA